MLNRSMVLRSGEPETLGDGKCCGLEVSAADGLGGKSGSEKSPERTRSLGLDADVGAVDFPDSKSESAVGLDETMDSDPDDCRGGAIALGRYGEAL